MVRIGYRKYTQTLGVLEIQMHQQAERKKRSLFWGSMHSAITQKIESGVNLSWVIAPYVKLEPLRSLVDSCANIENLLVISSWQEQSIVSGSTDIEIYPYLKSMNVPLYSNTKIHLKLFVFDDGTVFHTSGNVSRRGLGLGSENENNIEVGCFIKLATTDFIEIKKLIRNSKRINEEDYEIAKQYVLDNELPRESALPPLNLTSKEKVLSLDSFPETETPEKLYEKYVAGNADLSTGHDLALYTIPEGLNSDSFFKILGEHFTNEPFITELVLFIQKRCKEKEINGDKPGCNYGYDISEWIIQNCTDNPRPTKFEINEGQLITRLYEWLQFFYEEITWNVPGRHSAVVYWND